MSSKRDASGKKKECHPGPDREGKVSELALGNIKNAAQASQPRGENSKNLFPQKFNALGNSITQLRNAIRIGQKRSGVPPARIRDRDETFCFFE